MYLLPTPHPILLYPSKGSKNSSPAVFKERKNLCCGELLFLSGSQKCWSGDKVENKEEPPALCGPAEANLHSNFTHFPQCIVAVSYTHLRAHET